MASLFLIRNHPLSKPSTFSLSIPSSSLVDSVQYYYIHLFHRLSLLGGLFTLILYYVSSLLHRTLIYPKKYLSHTNKSLRQFNLKLVPNPTSHPLRNLPILRWIFKPKIVLGEGGVKVVLNQRGGIGGEFIEGWEMFREDFWEEEEKFTKGRRGESEERGKTVFCYWEPVGGQQGVIDLVGTGEDAWGGTGDDEEEEEERRQSGSVSSVKTASTGTGSVKEKSGKKKTKKRTAEQAVAGL